MVAVGLNYQSELREFIWSTASHLDYLEIVPDIGWVPTGSGGYANDPDVVSFLDSVRQELPLIAHSIGLSIASAHRFRHEHLAKIAEWNRRFDFLWHSEHLGYNFILDIEGREYTVGVPLPIPFTKEMLELVAERVRVVQRAISRPFLLEHNSSYVRFSDDEFTEAEFMNLLCEKTGCSILLDLHNIYVNWRNGLDNIASFLAELDLQHVVEVHFAGGLEYGDYYLDAHSGVVPDELWGIARDILPECGNVRGLTFELLGSWYQHMGESALRETIDRMRELAG